jgi:hypothetical protein
VTRVSKHEKRLNVRGENTVAGVASGHSDRVRRAKTGVALVRAMEDERLHDLHFEHPKLTLAVRYVKL